MTRIKQDFGDTAGNKFDCKLRVTLMDVLVNSYPPVTRVHLPEPVTYDVPNAEVEIELPQSATQRVVYHFELFTQKSENQYFLNDTRYFGPTHWVDVESAHYTGVGLTSENRKKLDVVAQVTETPLYDFQAILPDVEEVAFTDLVSQAVVTSRYASSSYYQSLMVGLPGSATSPVDLATLLARVESLETEVLALKAA